jgi:hypothetical protein
MYNLSTIFVTLHALKTESVEFLVDVTAHGGDDRFLRHRGPYFEYVPFGEPQILCAKKKMPLQFINGRIV